MNLSAPALHRLLSATAILLLAAAPAAAVVRKGRAPAARPAAAKPAAPNNSIIALPLAPIVAASQRVCTARAPSGLGYTILRPATGAKPGSDATVLVNYIGYLAASGAVFDQGMRSPLPVSGVIAGFGEGLQLVARGGVVRLCIPAAIGYGAQASGPIPANADLVFQVEVLDFKSAAEIDALRKAQPADAQPTEALPPPKDPAPQP